MPYVGKTSILINYLMVSYVWTQNQSFATPSTFHVVFLQFDFSESQKVDILYCIYYTCKFSLPYGFSDDLQSHSLWLQALSYKFHLCGFVAETSTQETKHHIQRVGELKFIMSAGPEVVTP